MVELVVDDAADVWMHACIDKRAKLLDRVRRIAWSGDQDTTGMEERHPVIISADSDCIQLGSTGDVGGHPTNRVVSSGERGFRLLKSMRRG